MNPTEFTTTAGHLPLARPSFAESVDKMESEGEVDPTYKEGYDLWKTSFTKGKGGIFTIRRGGRPGDPPPVLPADHRYRSR